jgi:hypothetical protein
LSFSGDWIPLVAQQYVSFSWRYVSGTVAGAATTFVASLPIPLEIKAPATALASTVTGAILLYWKNKVNKQ